MRQIGQIPHPEMSITLFEWNGKYMVKFEIGLYEQVFKVKQDSLTGLDSLKSWVDADLCTSVMQNFLSMRGSFHDAIKRNTTQS